MKKHNKTQQPNNTQTDVIRTHLSAGFFMHTFLFYAQILATKGNKMPYLFDKQCYTRLRCAKFWNKRSVLGNKIEFYGTQNEVIAYQFKTKF